MSRKKTRKEYEELFEDLMQYTDFKDSGDIKTNQDLFDFFGQVQKDANSKGRAFKITKQLFSNVASAINLAKEPILSRRVKAIRSKKTFKNIEDARKADLDVTLPAQDKVIFKTSVRIKGRIVIRWRDNKGRWAKAPKE